MAVFDGPAYSAGFGGGRLRRPRVHHDTVFAGSERACETNGAARDSASDRKSQPKIAFARWLQEHPGKKPTDFQPLIGEAEFAYRCRAAFVPACDDLGGGRATERQLRNLELGLCGGWRVLAPREARSLSDWLDAVLPHHPWGAVLEWRGSEAQLALSDYCGDDHPRSVDADTRQAIGAANLADAFDHACCFSTWRDVQSLVLSAWLGGALLVDENGHLIADWKEAFAEVLAARAES